jgi:hypothetical protein
MRMRREGISLAVLTLVYNGRRKKVGKGEEKIVKLFMMTNDKACSESKALY